MDGRACRRQTHLLEEARVKIVPHVPSRAGPEIGGYRRVWARVCYFPARISPEGRSEGDAPVGVFLGRKGGRREILPVKVAGGKVFR